MLDVKKTLAKILSHMFNVSGYMRAYLGSNQTLPQGTATTLNLNTIGASHGNGLTFNSSTHEVVVGDGVSAVQVSASGYVFTLGTAGSKNIIIQKNGTNMVRSLANLTNNYNTLSIPAFVFPVNKGDKIRLVATSNNGTTTVIGGGSSETWLNVRVIA